MQEIPNTLTEGSLSESYKMDDIVKNNQVSISKKNENVENNIVTQEQNFFSSLFSNILSHLNEKFGSHKLKHNKQSHYLETLFLTKVNKNNKWKKEASKEFNGLLGMKHSEKGMWLEEILYREEKNEKGDYWQQIRTLSNMPVVEQMVELLLIHEKHLSTKYEKSFSHVLDFSLKLAQLLPSKRSSKNIKTIKEVEHVIGQIIFLAEYSIDSFLKIENEDPGIILSLINEEFSKKMDAIQQLLNTSKEQHQKTRLQSWESAYWNQLILKLSEILVTSRGSVNHGVIDLLIQRFISLESYPTNVEQSIFYGLKQIQDNPLVRIAIEKINAPESSYVPSYEVIKAALNLYGEETITDIHAKKTAIAAFLSLHRQTSMDSCFATSFAIKMKETHPLYVLKDFHSLLNKGKLIRKVNGVSKDIPFLKRIEDNLNREVEVNFDGRIILNGIVSEKLWDAPGIQAVCKALRIKEPQKAIIKILEEEFSYLEEIKTKIRIKTLLKKLSAEAVKIKEEEGNSQVAYSQACFAFSSETTQPLAKVWENCIAGMAETAERSMIKSKIMESFVYSLERELDRLKVPVSEKVKLFLKTMQGVLKQSISLKYDPCLETDVSDESMLSGQGGFVLYNNASRIDNQKQFCKFAKEIIEKTYQQLIKDVDKKEVEAKEKEDLNDFGYYYKSLLSYTDQLGFVENLLAKYRSKRVGKYFDKKRLTPWITKTGNDSKKVLDVYFESNNSIKTHSIVPTDSLEFAVHLIRLGKELNQDNTQFLANRRMAIRIHNTHALTGVFHHPLFYRAIKSKRLPQKWLERHILQPGLKISQTKLDKDTQQKTLENLKNNILPKFLSIKESKKYWANLDNMSENFSKLTIKEFRYQLLELFQNFEFLNPIDIAKIAHQLDSCICNSFTPDLKEAFLQSVFYFSDTNWSNGFSNVYLCLVFNPCTEKLEIWSSQENGENFSRLKQDEWLINKEWEFFVVPHDNSSKSPLIKIYD